MNDKRRLGRQIAVGMEFAKWNKDRKVKAMKMISYWRGENGGEPTVCHREDELTLIYGYYNHKNQQENGDRCLGIHWQKFPQSRGYLAPCVIPTQTALAFLNGLAQAKIARGEEIDALDDARAFLENREDELRLRRQIFPKNK